MSEHSPITRRYLRSNVNSFGNSRNRNGHPSINLEKPMARTVVNSVDNTPKNAPQRATHTRGSLLNFKAVLNVEDVDAAMVKRMSLGGGGRGSVMAEFENQSLPVRFEKNVRSS